MLYQLVFKGLLGRQVSPNTSKVAKRRFTSDKAKRLFSFSRWLHIYVSSALFGLLFFFCFTGITLNHPDWVGKSEPTNQTLVLPDELTKPIAGELPLNSIQHYIEKITGLSNPRSVDVALDIGEITYDYPLPAGYAFVSVFIEDKQIEIEHGNSGLTALLNDLHKGRHSGVVWAWVIDVSAVLMLLFTTTGIIILLQNAKHRRNATLFVIIGFITPVLIYLMAVPRLI